MAYLAGLRQCYILKQLNKLNALRLQKPINLTLKNRKADRNAPETKPLRCIVELCRQTAILTKLFKTLTGKVFKTSSSFVPHGWSKYPEIVGDCKIKMSFRGSPPSEEELSCQCCPAFSRRQSINYSSKFWFTGLSNSTVMICTVEFSAQASCLVICYYFTFIWW